MNKIYKIVWSKAVGAYVVTSELAKSHTKSPSGKGLRRGITAALLAAVAVAPVSFDVYAADDTHYVSVNSTNKATDSNYDNDGAKAKNSIAIGPSVETTGEDNIVIGSGEIVSQDKKNGTSFDGTRVLVIGHGNYFQPTSDRGGQTVSYRDSAIIGHENKLLQGDKDDAGGGTPAYQIVHGWKNTLKGSFTGAIGYENEIKNSSRPGFTSQSMAFTIGTENTIDATGYYMGDKNRVNTLPDYKEPGSNPNVVGSDLYVIGRHNIIGSSKGGEWYVDNGRIFGSENIVYSNDANVFGWLNKVYASNGLAIGDGHRVGVDDKGNLVKNKNNQAIYNPVAVGRDNAVTGDYGVAVGNQAKSRGEKATAVGSTAQALSDYSAALGTENRAKGYGSVAVGSLNNTYDFDNPGYKWVDFDSVASSSAMGVMNISTGKYSSAVGVQNKALGAMASSFGYKNTTEGLASSSFGYSNKAAEKYSFAAGALNQASGQFSSAVGGWNQAEGKKSQAVGYRNFVSGHGAVALGSENNLNFVKQYQALGFVKTGDLSSALGISNVTAGNMSMGIGNSNYAFGTKSVGVGLYNFSTGYETLAMGHYAVAGSEDLNKIDQVKYAAAIGNRAKSTITDAVAIGSFSNTTRDKGDYGYNPALGKAVTDTDITDDANIGTYRTELENARDAWQTSMEKAEELLHKIQTQQYANQAEYQQWGAEYEQLEADADAKLAAYDAAQKKVGDLVGAWQGQMAALSVGDEATGRTRQITGVAAGSADTDAVNVAQLKALNTKVDNGAIHYYSVTSDKKAAGSNYDNDGAKAADSMVIGIGSISEAQNSTVVGNNNTLKRYTADTSGSSSRNNIVVGQNLEVEGAYNAVFGTDYQNNTENRKTMAAGKYNTVIGVGNLAGYTAEKDPQDRFKWIYSKVEDGSDSQNVVVGTNNTATRGSLVIGSESEATSSGISVGHHNKVVSDEDFGVALGSNLVVDGYQSVAIGSESEAKADYATAIGQEAMAKADYTTAIGKGAVAEQEDSIAFGDAAKAQNKYSIAFGSFAKATARSGVAIGSSSLADREKGAIGYLAGEETSEVWKATQGAVSVGNKEKKYTRQITGVAAGSEDTDAVNVAQLKALNTKMAQGAIHYYSVMSDKKAAGSNFDNDGAKADDSMVIGIGSTAETKNSTVLGNNNTVKTTSIGANNIVAGQNIEVHGGQNAVFGTQYQNGTDIAPTKVAGMRNTVIGVGNLVGYVAKKVSEDSDEVTYEKARGVGNDENVVVGMTNIANFDSIVIGTNSEAKNKGTSVGHANKIGSDEGGVALGNNLIVNGYQAIAVGSQSKATADQATAIGQEASAEKIVSVALGYKAKAQNKYSTALGAFAKVTAEDGIAIGSGSLADRAAFTAEKKGEFSDFDLNGNTFGAVSVGTKDKLRQIINVGDATEDTDAVNLRQLKALDRKVAQGAIHYYSVMSDKKAAGSNFDNDGAKADDSMVIGIGSTSEVINSTVIGNNNTLKNTLKVGQRDRDGVMRNNSIVAGENIEVDGTRNAVFATDYKEGEHKLTKVAGKHNTVIGVGNLVGYTAKADPNNRNEFIYEKIDVASSHANVVVGMTNTVKGSSVVVGMNSEIKDGAQLGTSVGHANTIQGSDEYGLALGNKLLVEGYGAIAVGTESKATADDATAIGTEAVAEQEGSIAFGHAAEAKNKYSIAFGLFATAKARSGVAIGSSSLADREKGSIGYLAGENTSEVWKATKGAISVGNKEKKYTRQITGVAAGSEDTDAVNVAQLKAVQEIAAAKTTIEAGDNITVAPGATAGSYKISATDTTLKTADNALSLDGSKLNLSVEDTKGNKVTGSVDLKSIQSAVDTNTTYTMTGTENAADNTTTISLKDSNGKEQKVTVATKDTNTYTTGGTYDAENKKLVFTQNDPSKNYEVDVSKMISDVVDTDTRNTIVETDTVAVDATDKNADGSINYKLNVKTDGKIEKDNKGIVTGGTVYNETRIENDGKYIKAENTASQNLIALDKQVDANTTNITKLENNIYDMGGRIGELGNRVDRVGAGAAALAALHPLDFDPDDKWDFAAGYGNYSGANAVAIGAYYRPNEDTMFSVGGSFGGGENMVNAGVSVKLGQGNNVSTSKVVMAKDMLDMQRRMAEMEAQMARMQGFIGALTGMDAQAAMFPDVPENHWAYEYVKGLCEQGIIEGYPDGNFAGDRSMTRYELAAMLYRALAKGVSLDARAVQEFAPELARIRVDVITKDNDGQPVIERVRVNEEKKEK